MSLTKEQLLQPRYRVIAEYPGCMYKAGDIITFDERNQTITVGHGVQIYTTEATFQKYPHLFQRVHWSDNRLKGEFPEYVLFDKSCVPAKVLSVKCDETGFVTEIETDAEPEEYYRADIWDFPATQEEYEAGKNRKQ